eukprot:scaffold16630_cov177-Amphora_coffeaeformis.AAC.8
MESNVLATSPPFLQIAAKSIAGRSSTGNDEEDASKTKGLTDERIYIYSGVDKANDSDWGVSEEGLINQNLPDI